MYVRFVGNVMTGTHSHAINVVLWRHEHERNAEGAHRQQLHRHERGHNRHHRRPLRTTPGPADSGSKLGEGIQVTQQGKNLGTVTITNNFIRNLSNGAGEFGQRVVDVQTLGPVATGQAATPFDVKIVGNDLDSGYHVAGLAQAAI